MIRCDLNRIGGQSVGYKMKQNAKHGGCDRQPTAVGKFFDFPLRGSASHWRINPKYISRAFVETIYGEAERAHVKSDILGTGFFILCNECRKFNGGRN